VERRRGGYPPILVGILSTAAIAFCIYSPVPENFLTGTDTLTTIGSRLVNSAGDVLRTFTDRLMAGTRRLEIAKSHGPPASLSYGKFSLFMNL